MSGVLAEALIEAKVGVGRLRDGIALTERELAAERKQLEDAERRGRLAAGIPDPETVAVAERFAARHRERAAVLERKLAAQRDELALAEREAEEIAAQLRAARRSGPNAGLRARREVEAAGRARPGSEPDADPLRAETDRARMEAAVREQLAHLKRKLGRTDAG